VTLTYEKAAWEWVLEVWGALGLPMVVPVLVNKATTPGVGRYGTFGPHGGASFGLEIKFESKQGHADPFP
jgi:hypothetical protein